NASNVSIFKSGSNVVVQDSTNHLNKTFPLTEVKRVQFVGGAGNDWLVDNLLDVPVQAWGYGGDDHLEGSNGNDILVGGDNNDTLVGWSGDDQMWGEGGDDDLSGGKGRDYLAGGA